MDDDEKMLIFDREKGMKSNAPVHNLGKTKILNSLLDITKNAIPKDSSKLSKLAQ